MNFKDDSIFFIIPCFNEEKRLDFNYWSLLLKNPKLNLIFVNDGSNDRTLEILIEFESKNQNVEVLNQMRNCGKSEAIRTGIQHVMSNQSWVKGLIGYLDSDSAFAVKDIQKIVELAGQEKNKNINLFIGSRVALQGREILRNNFRHIISRVLVTILGFFYRSIPYDIQSGFKIFQLNSTDKNLFENKFKTRWFVDFEIILRLNSIRNKKVNIWEEPVTYWKDVKGSKINFKEKVRIFFEIFYIIFRILRNSKWT